MNDIRVMTGASKTLQVCSRSVKLINRMVGVCFMLLLVATGRADTGLKWGTTSKELGLNLYTFSLARAR